LALRAPVNECIWFAGEATSVQQWGTVGGAWLEGQRAALEIKRYLESPATWRSRIVAAGCTLSHRWKARPRNLT
jgi:hypothetical protein